MWDLQPGINFRICRSMTSKHGSFIFVSMTSAKRSHSYILTVDEGSSRSTRLIKENPKNLEKNTLIS